MEMEFYGQRFRRVAKLRILSVYGILAYAESYGFLGIAIVAPPPQIYY